MLSYLPCSAERSYIQRKAHMITFFLINLIMKAYFFLHKINKAYKFYKIYQLQKILSKTFSGMKHSTFQNWKMRWKKWGDMYFELMGNLMCSFHSCCVWNEIKVSFSKYYVILFIFTWISCKLEIRELMIIFVQILIFFYRNLNYIRYWCKYEFQISRSPTLRLTRSATPPPPLSISLSSGEYIGGSERPLSS